MRLSDCAAGVRSRPPDTTEVPHDPVSAPLFTAVPTQAFHPSGPTIPIRRDRLVRMLGAVAPEVPLVLLVAPPGYGKTTALQQWAAEDRRRFGWALLEDSDNDPARLLRHIALALHQIHPLEDAVWRALDLPDLQPRSLIVRRLIASVAACGEPWVLVLDDFHALRGGNGMDLILALVEDLPAGCHLVVASRHKPGLRLGRLRAQGRCVQLGREELALSRDETRAVLAAAGLDHSEDAVEELLCRTEGWPAGLRLTGTDGALADYFREEVLAGESAETVALLPRIAVLDELSGPLCDAVLDRTDGTAWLAELESRNLFLIPLDRDRQRYRFHRLFAETLRAELRRRDAGEEALIHQRAAVWYAAQGRPEEAISHAIAAGDTAMAAKLMAGSVPWYLNTGRLDTVRGWLDALADDALDRYPQLAAEAGWIWAMIGDGPRAHRCLRAAEAGTRGVGAPDDGPTAVSIATLRAALAPHGVERMLADAQRGFGLEAAGSPYYPLAATLLGVAHLLTGAPDAAARVLERAAHFGRTEHPSTASFALAQLSLLSMERGDWPAAADYASESDAVLKAAGLPDYLSSITAYAVQARIALHQGDVHRAWQYVDGAQRLYTWPSARAFPWLAAQSAILLGRLLLDLDDHPGAALKATDARRQLARLGSEGVLRNRYQQFVAELDRKGGPPVPGAMAPTAAELRILQLLPTHLTLSEIADRLYISRNTVKTQVASIYRKLRSSTRTQAVREGRNLGLIES
jgi:LuxR family transcriptional regulator, maltose regulon positive regulatory protein